MRIVVYHETMILIQHRIAGTRGRRCAVAAAIALLPALAAGSSPALAEPCTPPGTAPVVLAGVENWQTLVTQSGERLTPSGIADFSALATGREATGSAADAERALSDAFSGLAGKSLGVRYLADRPDRRGRRPVLLYSDDRLVQALLIADGLAIAYPSGETLPCAKRLLAAERLARTARRGFWKGDRDWIAAPRADQFAGRLNRFVILQGRVLSVGTRKNRTYLNFGGRWSSDVTVEVPAGRRDLFGGTPALEALSGKWLRVRGFAVEKSGPMIEVRHVWQIEVLATRPR